MKLLKKSMKPLRKCESYLFLYTDHVAYVDVVQDMKWKITMDEEINANERNDTFSLTALAERRKANGVKLFKIKKNVNGELRRYKARLVAK